MTSTWIVLGDIHNDSTALPAIPELKDAEGLLITGDITLAQGAKQAAITMEPFIATGKKLLAQPGNMDKPEVLDWLIDKGWNIHRSVQFIADSIPCLGLGYSPITPFRTPGEYPDEQLAHWLTQKIQQEQYLLDAPTWIFASHTPPYDTMCDKLSNGIPVGSMAVRHFIERYQPTYCFCGHIHESAGQDTLGKTTIINPGAFADGGYIVLSINRKTKQATATLKKVNPPD